MRIVAGVGQFGHNPELDEDERLRYCVEMDGRVYTEAEMWKTWEHFIRAVRPAAAGVQLSHHADDPRRSRTARRGGSRSASAPGRRWRADGTR